MSLRNVKDTLTVDPPVRGVVVTDLLRSLRWVRELGHDALRDRDRLLH